MVASALALSVMFAFAKLAGARLPSQQIVFARAALSCAICVVLLRRARAQLRVGETRAPFFGRRRSLLLLNGVFGFLGLSCTFFAVAHLPLAETTVLVFTNPVFTALLAALFLREPLSRGVALGLALSFAGTVLIAQPARLFAVTVTGAGATEGLDLFAVGVAIAGAFFAGCRYVCVRKLGATEQPLVIVFWLSLVALPLTLPAIAQNFVMPRGWEWGWLLGVGVFAQLGQVALTRGLQHASAARATTFTYLQVAFAAVLGVLLFDEWPNATALAGAVLILAGAASAARR